MAKDGTSRGGARPNSGRSKRKQDALSISPATFPTSGSVDDNPVRESYYLDKQKENAPFLADMYSKQINDYLVSVHCDGLVEKSLIEKYAVNMARWRQAQILISKRGMLEYTASGSRVNGYVKSAEIFERSANQAFSQIALIVQQNGFSDESEKSEMELLLGV